MQPLTCWIVAMKHLTYLHCYFASPLCAGTTQVVGIFFHGRHGCTDSTTFNTKAADTLMKFETRKNTNRAQFYILLHYKPTDSHETFLKYVYFFFFFFNQIRPIIIQITTKNNACSMMAHTGYIIILETVLSHVWSTRWNTGWLITCGLVMCMGVFTSLRSKGRTYHRNEQYQKQVNMIEKKYVSALAKKLDVTWNFLLISFRTCWYKWYIQGHLRNVTSQKDQQVFSLVSPAVFVSLQTKNLR